MSRTPSTPGAERAARPNDCDARTVELLERLVAGMDALVIEMRTAHAGPPPLLTRDAMAALVGVDLRTLRRLELAGDVPRAVQVGSAKRWKRADVDAWLAGKRR